MPRVNPADTSTSNPAADPLTLNWWDFQSSRVKTAAYDPDTDQLYVEFQKRNGPGYPTEGPDGDGAIYTYEGVSNQEWRNLRRSQSPGKYVNRVLNGKNKHPGL